MPKTRVAKPPESAKQEGGEDEEEFEAKRAQHVIAVNEAERRNQQRELPLRDRAKMRVRGNES